MNTQVNGRINGVTLVMVMGAVLAPAACDWRQLDDAVEKAPIVALETPGGDYLSDDFGRILAPLPPPAAGPVAARFLAGGIAGKLGIVLVQVDDAGKTTVTSLGGLLTTALADRPIFSTAVSEAADGVRVYLGVPTYAPAGIRVGGFIPIKIDDAGTVSVEALTGAPTGTSGYGNGLAVGNVTGLPTQDLVLATDLGVRILPEGILQVTGPGVDNQIPAQPTCDSIIKLAPGQTQANDPKALLVGDFFDGPGNEVVMGNPGNPSTVTIGHVETIVDNTMVERTVLSCPTTIAAPPGSMTFGKVLAMGDLNGDGNMDLLVGAPPTAVFVYYGPISADPLVPPAPAFSISAPAGAEAFGFGTAIAVGDLLPANPGPEILISAPAWPPSTAGGVLVYTAAGIPLLGPGAALADLDPDDSGLFGEAVTLVKFRDAGCGVGTPGSMLVVGGRHEVFTYLRVPELGSPELRCIAP